MKEQKQYSWGHPEERARLDAFRELCLDIGMNYVHEYFVYRGYIKFEGRIMNVDQGIMEQALANERGFRHEIEEFTQSR